ncbi:MAG: hypothetical protein K8U57_22230 [Planctomycetes bacterium]|nr:hypothetical protein [Planctomycetota bacterium]
MNVAELTPELNALVSVVRMLPPELVRQVADFAEFLGKKHLALPIDESDEWTEEDQREIALAALRRFDAEHPDENWGTDYTIPEKK